MALVTQFRHAGIVVSDLEAALRFYGERLGFTVTKRAEESGAYLDNMLSLPDVKATTVKMKGPDGVLIELLRFYPPHAKSQGMRRQANDIGLTHLALTVANLDETYKTLSAAGIEFNCVPQLSPDGYAKVTFCRDPEGNLLELVEVLRK